MDVGCAGGVVDAGDAVDVAGVGDVEDAGEVEGAGDVEGAGSVVVAGEDVVAVLEGELVLWVAEIDDGSQLGRDGASEEPSSSGWAFPMGGTTIRDDGVA